MNRFFKNLAFWAIALGATTSLSEASEPISVFQFGGPGGSRVDYRIPVLATVEAGKNAGRIVAINDYRYCHADIGYGRIDLFQAISDDNGATWSAPQPLLNKKGEPAAAGDGWSPTRCGFGDAAIVSDRNSGKLLVIGVGGDQVFFKSRAATPNSCFTWVSDNGGDWWSEPTELSPQIYGLFPANGMKPIDGFFFASGRILQSRQIKIGDYYRIYAAIDCQRDGRETQNYVLYSDDFGKNWQILGNAPAIDINGDEAKVEELPDGNILFAGRGLRGNRNFTVFKYSDTAAAKGKWEKPVNTDMGMGPLNACNGEILIVEAKNAKTGEQGYVALQSFVNAPKREKVSIAWKALGDSKQWLQPKSYEKWDGVIELTPYPSAYSTMTQQKNGTIGVLYEESTYDKDYTSRYRNMTLSEITGGEWVID